MLRGIILLAVATTCIQLSSGRLSKWKPPQKNAMCSSSSRTNYDWLENRNKFIQMNQSSLKKDRGRLRKYINAYETAVHNFRAGTDSLVEHFELPSKPDLLQNEFITNAKGEYSLNYELDPHLNDKIRRVETGVYVKSGSSLKFVVRGLIAAGFEIFAYKLDESGFYKASFPYPSHSESIAKGILCACCAQHGTCSKLCGTAAAQKECSPAVARGEETPAIKEQWFRATRNGSYEFRTFFKAKNQGRSEVYQLGRVTSRTEIFGFFPYPGSMKIDLPYYFRPSDSKIYVGFNEFPDLDLCDKESAFGIAPGTGHSSGSTGDHSSEAMQLVKSIIA